MTPPQAGLRRRCALSQENPRKNCVESIPARPYAEIEQFHFRRRKYRAFPPVFSILALRVPVDEIILMIRARDVPHLPFAIVIDKIRLVDAPALPILYSPKRRRGLIDPRRPVPLQIPDRVRTPDIFRPAGVIDSFDPCVALWIKATHVRRTVSSPICIPGGARFSTSQRNEFLRCVSRQFPSVDAQRRALWQRRAENVWRALRLGLSGKKQPPSSVAMNDARIQQLIAR